MSSPLSVIEISASALQKNIAALQGMVGNQITTIPVVKANAYGHGMKEVLSALLPRPAAVQIDDIEELRDLRSLALPTSSVPALVLGYVQGSEIKEIIELNASVALLDQMQIPDMKTAARITGKKIRVHIAIDCLFGREGTQIEHLPSLLNSLRSAPEIVVEGVYGHLASGENPKDDEFSLSQLSIFRKAMQLVHQSGHPQAIPHFEASSGVWSLSRKQLTTDITNRWCRVGLSLYGMWPSPSLAASNPDIHLTPVMKWKTKVAQIKKYPAGVTIGYGRTYKTTVPTQLALLPIGHSDGFDRGLSSQDHLLTGEVLIQETRCPVVGRISMNMCVVDCSSLPSLTPGEEVVLIGSQGINRITAEEIGNRIGTVNYEITARISSHLPRIIVD